MTRNVALKFNDQQKINIQTLTMQLFSLLFLKHEVYWYYFPEFQTGRILVALFNICSWLK